METVRLRHYPDDCKPPHRTSLKHHNNRVSRTDDLHLQWFNFYSHTSQDSYTTFLRTQKGMNNTVASTASILMKTGACVGGTIIGYLSQWVGRRRAMCVAALISACLIPAWVLPNKFGSLAASGFMLQFFVQGAWGVSILASPKPRQCPHRANQTTRSSPST
jgi:MFS family permease